MTKTLPALLLLILALLLPACQRRNNVCLPDDGSPQSTLGALELASQVVTPDLVPTATEVEINGKMMLVDKVVEGPLCNDSWSGKVYVGCGVQVAGWEEEPTFLKDCDLEIEPGTVVYVAAHNNEAFYKGCSCHTGELLGD